MAISTRVKIFLVGLLAACFTFACASKPYKSGLLMQGDPDKEETPMVFVTPPEIPAAYTGTIRFWLTHATLIHHAEPVLYRELVTVNGKIVQLKSFNFETRKFESGCRSREAKPNEVDSSLPECMGEDMNLPMIERLPLTYNDVKADAENAIRRCAKMGKEVKFRHGSFACK